MLYAQKPEMTGEELLEQKEFWTGCFSEANGRGYRIDMVRPASLSCRIIREAPSMWWWKEAGAALVIDTGFGPEAITPWIRKITHLPLELCLTHCHGDHMLPCG